MVERVEAERTADVGGRLADERRDCREALGIAFPGVGQDLPAHAGQKRLVDPREPGDPADELVERRVARSRQGGERVAGPWIERGKGRRLAELAAAQRDELLLLGQESRPGLVDRPDRGRRPRLQLEGPCSPLEKVEERRLAGSLRPLGVDDRRAAEVDGSRGPIPLDPEPDVVGMLAADLDQVVEPEIP